MQYCHRYATYLAFVNTEDVGETEYVVLLYWHGWRRVDNSRH